MIVFSLFSSGDNTQLSGFSGFRGRHGPVFACGFVVVYNSPALREIGEM